MTHTNVSDGCSWQLTSSTS